MFTIYIKTTHGGLVIELQCKHFHFCVDFFQVLSIRYIFIYLTNYLHGAELRGRYFPHLVKNFRLFYVTYNFVVMYQILKYFYKIFATLLTIKL